MLKNKLIIIGITGGIAAYKIPILVRLLIKAGAKVRIIMTQNSTQFVTPLTLETVSQNSVITDMFAQKHIVTTEHIHLADETDLLLIAPATANIIGKYASGIADDFLSTFLFSFTGKVVVTPAMNVHMYHHPITQKNLKILSDLEQVTVLEPDSGDLACGYSAKGRMPEPEMLLNVIENSFISQDLIGQKFLITAGGTREYIDPVRFIGNPSSGKMGYAFAEQVLKRGGSVTLLSGATALTPPAGATIHHFTDVSSLKILLHDHVDQHDILIMSAAVGDWKPKTVGTQKTKKGGDHWDLPMVATEDLLKSLNNKTLFKIGFAAETESILEHGKGKLFKKGLDMIVINDVSDPAIGFQSDQNRVTLMWQSDGETDQLDIDQADKEIIAQKVLDSALLHPSFPIK